MYIWKGAFAPLRKHHGGTLEDHIHLPTNGWSLDMDTLTVHFGVVTHDDPRGDGQMYWAEFKVTPEQALHMTSDTVVELIADQLKRKPGKRTWELPPGHDQPDEQED